MNMSLSYLMTSSNKMHQKQNNLHHLNKHRNFLYASVAYSEYREQLDAFLPPVVQFMS